MKNRRAEHFAPAFALTAAVVVLGLAGAKFAAARDQAPPPRIFVQDGQAYRWSVAHGVVGALRLSRAVATPDIPGLKAITHAPDASARAYAPQLVLACSDRKSGVMTGATRVSAGDRVFLAPNGHGLLPRGFFPALGSAQTISATQGGRTTTYPGPGAALAAHFERYCASLSRRANVHADT